MHRNLITSAAAAVQMTTCSRASARRCALAAGSGGGRRCIGDAAAAAASLAGKRRTIKTTSHLSASAAAAAAASALGGSGTGSGIQAQLHHPPGHHKNLSFYLNNDVAATASSNGNSIFGIGGIGQRRDHYAYSGPGSYDGGEEGREEVRMSLWRRRDFRHRGFTVGIGGPVGSGKTALVLQLCRALPQQQQVELAVVTNDIFTQEDAEYLVRNEALPPDRIRAVETGGCPHAAIREDISSNLTALEDLTRHVLGQQKQQEGNEASNTPPPLLLCESGGDNLAANFSSELADLTLYVVDVAGGDKVPRKGGPGITQSDLLIVNKVDLADAVGADLGVMEADADRMRQGGPTVFAAVKKGKGVQEIGDFIMDNYRRATNL